jgi:hypothetical protein
VDLLIQLIRLPTLDHLSYRQSTLNKHLFELDTSKMGKSIQKLAEVLNPNAHENNVTITKLLYKVVF